MRVGRAPGSRGTPVPGPGSRGCAPVPGPAGAPGAGAPGFTGPRRPGPSSPAHSVRRGPC
ncbi:hypothetical protein CXF45_11405 [Corynebacterium bovis]|nr:hypothetical protein CXF45_11405 [Corynebacterium bovis]